MVRAGIVWRLNMCRCPSTFCRLDRSYGNCSSWVATFQPTCQILCFLQNAQHLAPLPRRVCTETRVNIHQSFFQFGLTSGKNCSQKQWLIRGAEAVCLLYNTSALVTRRHGIYFFTGWIFHVEEYIGVVLLSKRVKKTKRNIYYKHKLPVRLLFLKYKW